MPFNKNDLNEFKLCALLVFTNNIKYCSPLELFSSTINHSITIINGPQSIVDCSRIDIETLNSITKFCLNIYLQKKFIKNLVSLIELFNQPCKLKNLLKRPLSKSFSQNE